MRDLRTLREGWDTFEADEIRLLQQLTVHELSLIHISEPTRPY